MNTPPPLPPPIMANLTLPQRVVLAASQQSLRDLKQGK